MQCSGSSPDGLCVPETLGDAAAPPVASPCLLGRKTGEEAHHPTSNVKWKFEFARGVVDREGNAKGDRKERLVVLHALQSEKHERKEVRGKETGRAREERRSRLSKLESARVGEARGR